MRVSLNGTPYEVPADATVATAAALVDVAPDERGVAAALEGRIVPRERWADTPIPDGARLEIVRATAGG